MANLGEWAKGITFFMFVTIMFYFLWDNIFSNIIDFVGTDIMNIGSNANTSIAIMKTATWVSFVLLYLGVGGVYLFHTIIVGANGNIETKPLELLKAIGIWAVAMPFLTFLYGLTYVLVDVMNNSNIIDSSLETTASKFSWIFSLIIFIALTVFPFIYVIKGYGIDLFGGKKLNAQ